MLSLKAMLVKILKWIASYPSNSQVNATKVGSVWQSGKILVNRRGHCCQLKIDAVKTSEVTVRTVIATIPEGYRPPIETEIIVSTTSAVVGVFYIESNGEIKLDPMAARTTWCSCTYPV